MVGYLSNYTKLAVQNKSRGACHTVGSEQACDHWRFMTLGSTVFTVVARLSDDGD